MEVSEGLVLGKTEGGEERDYSLQGAETLW